VAQKRVEGFLRNAYGFNDGLTANFGQAAGVIGAVATRLIPVSPA
jgi:hypothetical protein